MLNILDLLASSVVSRTEASVFAQTRGKSDILLNIFLKSTVFAGFVCDPCFSTTSFWLIYAGVPRRQPH